MLPDPEDQATRPQEQVASAPSWADEPRMALARGDLAGALALFAARHDELRGDPAGLRTYGNLCLLAGRPLQARYLLHRARALQPENLDLLAELGSAALECGDPETARDGFESVLEKHPEHLLANHGLAICLRRSVDPRAAIAHLETALRVQPDSVPILLELATTCRACGDVAGARRHFAELARVAPEDRKYWLAWASFLREQGEPAEAMRWIDRAGRLNPRDPHAAIEKARCLRAMGDIGQAMRWLERLEQRSPGIPENSEEYGHCMVDPAQASLRETHWVRAVELWTAMGLHARAEAMSDRLLAACPASARAWNARGRLENARQRFAEAEAAWQQAIACDSTQLDAAAGLAHLYEETNRGEAAADTARAALRFARTGERPTGAIELHLALCKAARRGRNAAAGLVHLADAATLAASDPQRAHVAFERGWLLDQAGDPTGAFAAFAQGNALSLAEWQAGHPGPNRYLAGVEALLERVRGGWIRDWQADEPPSPFQGRSPAFLVGFPRSGTSLLNHVLDGHSRIQALEEKPPTQKMVEAMRNMPGGYPDALAHFDAIDAGYLREVYFREAAAHGADDASKLLFDKFPLHLNVACLLHRVFPQARFVFALRHPCDVVLSCFMQQFRLNHAMANFCTLEDAVALYARTMDLWELVRTQLPLAVHSVRYEDVVADFDGRMRALCDFLQVPWEEGLRDFSARARGRGRIDTPSYAQVSRPLYREATYRWERYRDALSPWLPALQPYIERFGYA